MSLKDCSISFYNLSTHVVAKNLFFLDTRFIKNTLLLSLEAISFKLLIPLACVNSTVIQFF